MRADGTAATKGAATSCASAATAMSVAVHNSQTFSPRDTIYICDNGGTYTQGMVLPSSGTAGSPIVYTISGSPVWGTSGNAWFTNAQDWVVINGIQISASTGFAIYLNGSDHCTLSNINATSGTGILLENCVSPTLSQVATSATSQDALQVSGSNASLTNVSIGSAYRYGLWLNGVTGTAAVTSGTISNTQFEGIRVDPATNGATILKGITLSNVGLNGGASSAGVYFNGGSVTGVDLNLSGLTITHANGLGGIYLRNAPFETHRATITTTWVTGSEFGLRANNARNVDITKSYFLSSRSDGIYVEESSGTSDGFAIDSVVVGNSGRDGISFANGASNSAVRNSEIFGSGQQDAPSNGDGLTIHQGCTGLVFAANRVWGNRSSGFAGVLGTAAELYDNTFEYNGDASSTYMAVRGGFYHDGLGGTYTLERNSFTGNYPYEMNVAPASVLINSAIDYNFYDHVGNGVTEAHFAFLDGNTVMNWAAYHARYEVHSQYVGSSNPSPAAFAVGIRPNPSAGAAQIEYTLPQSARVKVAIFDIAGRQVAQLVDGLETEGRHTATWDGSGDGGRTGAGVYFVRYETPSGNWTKRFVLMR